MTKQAALLVDLQRIHSHQFDDDHHLVLGLTFQLAFTADFDDSSTDDLRWTKLWRWSPITRVDLHFLDAAGNVGTLSDLEVWKLKPTGAQPVAPASMLKVLDGRVEQLLAEAKRTGFVWSPNNPDAATPVEGHVFHLQAATARTANKVPYLLNLAVVVAIKKSQIPLPGHILPPDTLVYAIPRLRWNAAGGGPEKARFVANIAGPLGPKAAETVEWKYVRTVEAGAAAKIPELSAWLKPADLADPDPDGVFINLKNGLVRNALYFGGQTGPTLEQSEDWMGRVVDRVAESWDLARHLLDAARVFVTFPLNDFRLFWKLVLATLRDRAGLGLIDSTDGSGLLKFAVNQLYPLQEEYGTAPPTTEERLLRDGRLRSLQALLYDREQHAATLDVDEWIKSLTTVLPSELAAKLTPVPDMTRWLTFEWSPDSPALQPYKPGDPNYDAAFPDATPLFPTKPGQTPVLRLRLYPQRNSTAPIPSPLPPAVVGGPHNEFYLAEQDLKAQRSRTENGGGQARFDGYQQDLPLPVGWYEAVVVVGSTKFQSQRVYYGFGVQEDVQVLRRIWTELQSPDTLAALLIKEWNRLLADAGGLSVPAGGESPVWFSSVWTDVNTASATLDVVSRRVGEIRPLDGRTWVVSLCDIRHASWIDGEQYRLEFHSPIQDPDGSPVVPVVIEVRVTLVNDAAGKRLKLSNSDGTAQAFIAIAANPYHLRVELSRTGVDAVQVAVFCGMGDADAVTWSDGPIFSVVDKKLARVDVRVNNGLAVALDCAAPTLVTALESLKGTSFGDAWYHSTQFRPGRALWNKAAPKLAQPSDGRPHSLARLDLSGRLALGQTARLVTVWHKQLERKTVDYVEYLVGNNVYRKQGPAAAGAVRGKLDEQMLQLWQRRLAVNKPVEYVDGPYRDFLPFVSAQGLHAQICDAVKAHLESFAWSLAQRLVQVVDAALPYHQQEIDRFRTPVPHTASIQIDRPAMFSDTIEQGDDVDFLRQIAGFIVLLRQGVKKGSPVSPDGYFTDQPWSILNCVDVGVLDSTLISPTRPVADWYPSPDDTLHHLVAPTALQYQNNTRQATISYRNKHLAAHSALEDIAHVFDFAADGFDQAPPPFMPLPPDIPTSGVDFGFLTILRFGFPYQALVGVMGNCANQSAVLTGRPAHPSLLRTDLILDAELRQIAEPEVPVADWPRDSKYLRRFKYLRRVGIGIPRIQRQAFPDPPLSESAKPRPPVLPLVPRDVRSLAQEWGLQGLTSHVPWARLLFDSASVVGQVQNTTNWVIVVPRVSVAGSSDDDVVDASQEPKFNLFIGLRNRTEPFAGMKVGEACGALIERQGALWTVSVRSAVPTTVPTPPLKPQPLFHSDAGQLSGGPLDFRVAYAGGQIYVAWRRSDRQEPWNEWLPGNPAERQVQPITDSGWIDVERIDDFSRPTTVTFGTVQFAVGCVALAGKPPLPADIDSALRPLDADDAAPIVLPKPPDGRYDGETIQFFVRPPASDLETWEASWPKMLSTITPTNRRLIWGRHKLLSGPLDDREKFDGSLDDPAVTALRIELAPLRFDPDVAATVETTLWNPAPNAGTTNDPMAPGKPNPLNKVQKLAEKFTLVTHSLSEDFSSNPKRLRAGADGYSIHVREQEIWMLRIHPLVPEEYFVPSDEPGKQFFHSRFGEHAARSEGGFRSCSPFTLTIEVPTQRVVELPMLKAELLERKSTATASDRLVEREAVLLAAVEPQFDGQAVAVQLRKQSPRTFRYCGQIRLLRQVWRWRGRPLPPFPFASAAAANSTLDRFPDFAGSGDLPPAELDTPSLPMLWDAVGFGDRSAIDLLDQTKLISSDQRVSPLFREVLGDDRRTLYYRFTAQALSRYAGLFSNDLPIVMASEAKVGSAVERNAWRRLLAPCRREERPARPAIRFLLPLTESEEDRARGKIPGMLVVLDDAWFTYAGLGETLEAEVVRTADWWDTDRGTTKDQLPLIRPEFGPDPTLNPRGWTKLGYDPNMTGTEEEKNSVPDQTLMMDVVGPIGHTFDTDADAPLFNSSSFILRPPHTNGVDSANSARPLDWYFAKVRFRRALPAECMSDYRYQAPQSISETIQEFEIPGAKTANWNERAWVVDLAELSLDRVMGGTTTITITDNTDSESFGCGDLILETEQHDADVVRVKWSPHNGKSTTSEMDLFAESDWAHLTLSVRFVLQLESDKPIPNSTDRMCHLTVQFRINGAWHAASGGERVGPPVATAVRKGVWHSLDIQTWAGVWPTKIKMSSFGAAACSPPSTFPCRNSDFTAPYWFQFLPDVNELLRPLLHSDDGSSSQPNRFVLQWRNPLGRFVIDRKNKPFSNETNTEPSPAELKKANAGVEPTPAELVSTLARIDYADQIYALWRYDVDRWIPEPLLDRTEWNIKRVREFGSLADWPDVTQLLPPSRPPSEKFSDVTWKTRIVLTELVSDVRGQLGEEKYLALYELSSDYLAIEKHRSPFLGRFRPDQQSANVGRRLRLRIIEFQVVDVKQASGASDPFSSSLTSGTWDDLFPVDSDKLGADAGARIVRVSPPLELTESLERSDIAH